MMPMMIAMAIASTIAGQLMSRLGHYRILGVLGLMLMVAGVFFLSQMDVDSTRREATTAMIVFGIGLGTSMPLFSLAVQNAVPYRVMGVSTSTLQFLRSVGGTMGVAILFSLIQSQYHAGVESSVPASVRAEPGLSRTLEDPQFLLNSRAFEQVHQAFLGVGGQGQALFDQTIFGVRESLAAAIADAFLVAVFILAVSVVVAVFMKEIPLRKGHYMPEEELLADEIGAATPAGAVPSLRPIAGGANGSPSPTSKPSATSSP
jgi:hypothetical protein